MASIENATRLTRESRYASPTVTRFEEKQSLPARVKQEETRRRVVTDKGGETLREATNTNSPDVTPNPSSLTKENHGAASLPVRRSLLVAELWIAGTCCFLQFFLGVAAVMLMAMGQIKVLGFTGDQLSGFASSALGGITLTIINLVRSAFGEASITVPTHITFTMLGLVFWGVALACTILGFMAILILLHFQRINVADNILLMIATIAAVALSAIPGLQIFPWMVVWVWAVYWTTFV